MRTPRIYFGAAYYDEYMPAPRVEQDLALMKEAGMNVIRIAESTWSTWEPLEGAFDFTSLHRVLEAAEKHGMSVIIGTPTYAIPPWLARKYPDILAETHSGPNRYGPRQNMDITHPAYRFYGERIIRRLMEQVRPYRCVIGFQLDNETKPYDTCGSRVQELFREYLKQKFGTVEHLNKSWGLAFWSNSLGSWDDLPDPRATINGSFAAEFETFQRLLVTQFLAWQRAIVDEYRREDQFVTHNFDFAWEPFHCSGLQPDADQFAMAESMTVAGCDIYHPSAERFTGMEISFGGDVARGLKQDNYLVLETQAQGPIDNFPWPGQLRLAAFAHLAGGANMIEYWHWHSIHNAIESHWKGVLSHDLIPGETYREIASIGRDLERIGDHLVNLRRTGPVAMVLSTRSQTAVRHDASFSGIDYNREMFSLLYNALYRLNIPCDMVSDRTRDFSRYSLVITPCLYSVEEDLIRALKDYVNHSGHLLSTYRSFFTDEHAAIRHAPQPYGLTDVFGITYDRFFHGRTVPEVDGFMELLRPDTAQTLKSYDHPHFFAYAAVTLNDFGRGKAAWIGARFAPDALEAILEDLLPRLGIPIPEDRFPLIVKEGVNDYGRKLRYLLNCSDAPVSARVPMDAAELLSGAAYAQGQTISVAPWSAAILEEIL